MSEAASPEADAQVREDFDPERFMRLVREVGHPGALGLQYRGHGRDWAELAMEQTPELVGMPGSGIIASGPIISLMDTVSGLSIWVRLGIFAWTATLDLRVDYLRPARPERTLVGRSECYRVTRSVAFVRGVAHDGDPEDPVANVTAAFMFTGG